MEPRVAKVFNRQTEAVGNLSRAEKIKLLKKTLRNVKIPTAVMKKLSKAHNGVCSKKHDPIKCALNNLQKHSVHGGIKASDVVGLTVSIDAMIGIIASALLVAAGIGKIINPSSPGGKRAIQVLWNIFTYSAIVIIPTVSMALGYGFTHQKEMTS